MTQEITQKNAGTRYQRIIQISFIMSLISGIGWTIFYVAIMIYLPFANDGQLAFPYIHPFAAGYLASGFLGSFLIKRKGRSSPGGAIIFLGYLGTTCTLVVLMFPLFIPPFDAYVYVMLSLLFLGLIGGGMGMKY